MSYLRNEGPIAVFDSGLGGLSLLGELQRRLPLEDFVYFGDTARAPYGTRGKQTILNYTRACGQALRDYRVKLLVFACNTAAAVALEQLSAELFVPAVGPIVPGLRAALRSGGTHIGVLASSYLAASTDYAKALANLAAEASVQVQRCQLLAALSNEPGVPLTGELGRLVVSEHLTPLVDGRVQVLVLGNSRLSVMRAVIAEVLAAMSGAAVALVDSTVALADEVAEQLQARQLGTRRTDPGKLRVVLTDVPHDISIAERFWGGPLTGISMTSVDL